MDSAGPFWVDVQKKTFTNWTNDRLKKTEVKVESLEADFDDGIKLITLLQCLAPDKKFPKYHAKPKIPIHKNENLSIAFRFMTDTEKIPLVNIGPQDIIEHNLKLILGLVWSLILRYQISSSSVNVVEDVSGEGHETKAVPKTSAKKLLMGWTNAMLSNLSASNFTTDWNDGVRLSALVEHCQPGLIPDYASLDHHNALHNIENAMSLAEKHLNIPKVLQPEDLAVSRPDELSVMTYISYFCQPDSTGLNRLKNWINQRIPKPVTNFTTDWTDGCALGALTDAVSGGDFSEYESMKPENSIDNCQNAMDAAERILRMEKSISPTEFASPDLDQLLRVTYLTHFMYATPSRSPASGITLAGPGVAGSFSGSETSFVLKGRIPFGVAVVVTVFSPDGAKVPVQQGLGTSTNTYVYLPIAPGQYVVEVMVGGDHVYGSPLKVRHVAPSNADVCTATGVGLVEGMVNQPAHFVVNCEAGGTGELAVNVAGPSGPVRADIQTPREKNFAVTFTPVEVGPHVLTVLWDSTNIPGSPYTCNVTDPRECSAQGVGLGTTVVVGQPQQFSVVAERAGEGILTSEGLGTNGTSVPVHVRKERPGHYVCSYTLSEPGTHLLHIWWSGVPITGSPFSVHGVLPPNASNCKASGLPTGRLQVGKLYKFTVDTSGAGSGVMDTMYTYKDLSVPEQCEVSLVSPGVYQVLFVPHKIGLLHLEPTYSGAPIVGAPFQYKVNDPSKCVVKSDEISKESFFSKHPIRFEVSAEQAGEGDITATVSNVHGATEDMSVSFLQDGAYLCHYQPSGHGQYIIKVLFDKVQIPNMPLKIFIHPGSPADRVVVVQPVPGPFGAFMVGQPYEYKINTSQAGVAKLAAAGQGKISGSVPSLCVDGEPSSADHKVTLEASVPDQYVVNIKWGEEGVPGSPFLIKVEDKPHADRVVVEGPHHVLGSPEPVKLAIKAEKAGAGELKVTCRGEKVGAVPVDIQEPQPKTFNASFGAKDPDVYTINVLWADVPVPGSPFKVDTTPPDASKCIVSGPDVPLETFKPVELVVDATSAGNGQLTAEAIGKSTGAAGSIDIKELSPGKHTYTIHLHTTTADIYTLTVRWAGQHVGKSPYTLNLHPPAPNAVAISKAPTQTMDAGQSISISFGTKKAGRGALVATCVGSKVGEVPTRAIEMEGSIWDVKFAPSEPDVYSLSVKWGRQHIRGSPFTINLMPINIDSVQVVGPTQPEKSSGLVELQVITKGAGKGKVIGKVSGSQAGIIPVQVVETEKDVFLVSFNPPMTDIYSLEVLFGGQHVRGSPFCINTLHPDASKVIAVQATAAELSQVLSFSCDTSQAGSGVLTSSCHGDKHGSVQVDVAKVGSDRYTISFTPCVPDRYNLRIEWSGVEVKGSPFLINLLPIVPYKVGVGELHVPTSIGKGEMVYVDLDYSHVGQAPTVANVKGSLIGHIPVDVDTISTFVRRVKFVPRLADLYHLSIQFGEGHICGSPFVINMLPPQSDKVELLELMTPFGTVGPVSFLFDTSKAGKGTMSIQASGNGMGPVASQVRAVGPGRHKAWFTAPQPDMYKVDVMWEGSLVRRFPFTISLLPPCYPERVICGQPVVRTVGKAVVTTIDISKAGKGNITALCQGRKSGLVNVEVEVLNPTTYKATFIPDVEDIYDLRIFCDDKEVSGSPLKVSLVPVKEEIELQMVEEQIWIVTIPPEYTAPPSLPPVASSPDHLTSIPPVASSPDHLLTSIPRTSSVLHQTSSLLPLVPRASSTLPRPLSHSYTTLPPQPSRSYTPLPPQPSRSYTALPPQPSRSYIPLPPQPSSSYTPLPPQPSHSYTPPLHSTPLPLNVGDALKILFIHDAEGFNELEATAVGDESGLTDIKVSDNGDNTTTIIFSPDKADRYVVAVLLNGEHIPYSPFVVSSLSQVSPEKCVIFGLKGATANPTVNQELKFGVNASKAGEGTLNVRSEGPSEEGYPSELEVYPGEQPGVSHVVYIPTAPGVHHIYLTWSDVPIPGSPIEFNVKDVEEPQINIYPVGKKVSQEIRVDCKLADLSANCSHKETGTECKVKIRKVASGLYKFKIIPKATGTYMMHILARGKEIAESPLDIKVGPPPDPAAVQVLNCPKTACIDQPVHFTVDASQGGGAGSLSVKLMAPNGAKDCPITTKCKAQVYTVTFVPTSIGEHTIGLKWANQPLPGGPWVVSVKEKDFDIHTGLAMGTNVMLINHPVGLRLLHLPPGHKVIAQAVGTTVHDNIQVDIDSQPDQCYIHFQPNRSDRYLLHVKVNDSHINGSPFRVVAVDPRSLAPGSDGLTPALMPLLGKPVNLIMPFTTNNENTKMEVVTQGPYESLPTSINTAVDGITVLSFTPKEPGEHLVQAKFGETLLENSPFAVRISPWRSDCHLLEEDLGVFSKVWRLEPGIAVSFRVSTEFGGEGKLDALVVEGPSKSTEIKATVESSAKGKATVESSAKGKATVESSAKGTEMKAPVGDPAKATDIELRNNSDGTHTCTIMPWAAGRYIISVLWNGEHIDGSPFAFEVKPPDVITGLDLQKEVFHVGVPHNMTLNCDFTENGRFELICKPPTGAEIHVDPIPGRNAYKCEITPQVAGPHELNVLYNSDHILGSPFFVQFADVCGALYCTLVSSSAEQSELGQPVDFIVSTKGAGEGTLTAEVQNLGTGAVFPVTVEPLKERYHYKVQFTPGQSNKYLLAVKFDGQHIVGSPFSLVFAEDQSAGQCWVEGEGLTVANLDKPNKFLVHTASGESGEEGGKGGELQVLIQGDSNMKGPHTFKRNNNTYEILYTPSREGEIQVIIKWEGEHVRGSPFNVLCCRPSDPSLFSIVSAPNQTQAGKETIFKVRNKQSTYSGALSTSAKSSSGKTAKGTTKALTKQEYECVLPPLDAGVHEVSVHWNGKDIPGSPFTLTVIEHPLLNKIKVEGRGLTNGIVGQECEFAVDTSDGGVGTLAIKLHGPKGALKFKMKKHPDEDRKIVVTYIPVEEGTHKIAVNWSGVPVPGSPFLASIA